MYSFFSLLLFFVFRSEFGQVLQIVKKIDHYGTCSPWSLPLHACLPLEFRRDFRGLGLLRFPTYSPNIPLEQLFFPTTIAFRIVFLIPALQGSLRIKQPPPSIEQGSISP